MIPQGMKKGDVFQDGSRWFRVLEALDKTTYISMAITQEEADAAAPRKIRTPKVARETPAG